MSPMVQLLSGIIIVVTVVGVAIGRWPYFRMNRATIALTGATILMVLGAIGLEEAYAALDLDTLTLLFAMMILNVNLRRSGFFQLVANRVIHYAHFTRPLLALIVCTSGVLSALFLNDTIVLTFTPLVLEICLALKRRPIPYLIGLVAAANVGSVATIIGNPQNMVIGISSQIPFRTFSFYQFPIAAVGMALILLVIFVVYRQEFRGDVRLEKEPSVPLATDLSLLRKSLVATGLMMAAFLLGMPIPLAALAAAALLLLSRRQEPEMVFREIDWSLLVFFAGLFIVTGSIETLGWSERIFAVAQPVAERGILGLTLVAVVLSNLVSNVPAVLLFRPVIPQFANVPQAWLTLAMATTLAGNMTLLGSVANLIVAEIARRRHVELGFVEYLKSGVAITLLTLTWGVLWLTFIF